MVCKMYNIPNVIRFIKARISNSCKAIVLENQVSIVMLYISNAKDINAYDKTGIKYSGIRINSFASAFV